VYYCASSVRTMLVANSSSVLRATVSDVVGVNVPS